MRSASVRTWPASLIVLWRFLLSVKNVASNRSLTFKVDSFFLWLGGVCSDWIFCCCARFSFCTACSSAYSWSNPDAFRLLSSIALSTFQRTRWCGASRFRHKEDKKRSACHYDKRFVFASVIRANASGAKRLAARDLLCAGDAFLRGRCFRHVPHLHFARGLRAICEGGLRPFRCRYQPIQNRVWLCELPDRRGNELSCLWTLALRGREVGDDPVRADQRLCHRTILHVLWKALDVLRPLPVAEIFRAGRCGTDERGVKRLVSLCASAQIKKLPCAQAGQLEYS